MCSPVKRGKLAEVKEIEGGNERKRLQTIIGPAIASTERAKWGKGQKLDKRQDRERLKVEWPRDASRSKNEERTGKMQVLFYTDATEIGIKGK